MKKILNPGSILINGRYAKIFVEITFENERLSFHGVVAPRKDGNCTGSCGQILDVLLDESLILSKGWSLHQLKTLYGTWQRWHLNDMRSECLHQSDFGWTFKTHQGQKCPTCGYEIGSRWLKEKVPTEVIEQLKNLPNSYLLPAWV